MMTDGIGEEAVRLRLLRLALLHGGTVPLKDLKPPIDATTRRRLEDCNFIERDCFVTSSRGRRVTCLSLTDTGWRWLAENFAGDVSRSSQCARELAVLLRMLRGLLDKHDLTFGEAVASHAGTGISDSSERHIPPTNTRDAIRAAYQALARTSRLERVRLADLRRRLPGISESAFDEALRDMEACGEAALYRLDNPLEIHDDDRRAAIVTQTGQDRHVVYLKGTR